MGGAPIEAGAARQPLEFVAPAIRADASEAGAPLLIPFLFITIACGAISGFHCLVSSGTSSKQIKCETDAQFVGYGSMLTEGFLATDRDPGLRCRDWLGGHPRDRRRRDRHRRRSLPGPLRVVARDGTAGEESAPLSTVRRTS